MTIAKRPKDFQHLALMIQEGLVTVEAIEHAIMLGPYTFLIPEYLDALSKVKTLLLEQDMKQP